jgi:SAM-dependent methyltransferase
MNESTKAKAFWTAVEKTATTGRGIDIGCGGDPVLPNCRCFDVGDGDANEITRHVQEQFDFVYSSHCLEHMHNPRVTILDWWKLVKPGGYLFVLVPDEDLYEQGVFPSRFNDDHKATFTISKAASWSPKSINVLDLANSLPGGQLVSLQLQDRGYNRSLTSFGKHQAGVFSRLLAWFYGGLRGIVGEVRAAPIRRALTAYYPVDQTTESYNAQAQIQLIVRKTG